MVRPGNLYMFYSCICLSLQVYFNDLKSVEGTMSEKIDVIRKEATKKLDQTKRSALGQFLTPSNIANFMASMFLNPSRSNISLLDAGAGIGSLTVAFIYRILASSNKPTDILLNAYEIDPLLRQYLKNVLQEEVGSFKETNVDCRFSIFESDFIKDSALKIESVTKPEFTHAILNPPYKKILSSSEHRRLLRLANVETVNLYSAFVSLALLRLKDKGELVAIIPRSFCNGNYYKSFRYLITDNAAINKIHLFESRNSAFKDDDVLQENIIVHLVKGAKQQNVTISRSTDDSFSDLTKQEFAFEQIIHSDDSERFIHIPSGGENHIYNSNSIKYDLLDLNLQVSTGPVVDFRAKEHLLISPTGDFAPLLYPIHFNCKEIDWPKESKKPNAIIRNAHTEKMLYPNGYYVVVRRFSSKEEKQRIVARVINPNKIQSPVIGIENHLNVFHYKKNGIDEDVAYGLAAFLNSTYVDTHFRTFNGHTQVNATDLKQMRYPDLGTLKKLGKKAKLLSEFTQLSVDKMIKEIL